MEIIWTRTKTIVSLSILLAAGLAWGIKHFYFPTVDDKFFQLDYQRLQTAPAKVSIFRPTKFEESRRAGAFAAPTRNNSGRYDPESMRLLGRNATLTEVIATAYQCQQSRVLLPANAATNGFDFLVTKPKAFELLQRAVKRKLGYTAHWQDREADVLELKVRVPNSAGLRPSTDGTSSRTDYNAGKLHFSHYQVQWLTGMMENSFDKPIIDKTGLTGFYDFAITWDWRGRRNGPDAEALKKSLEELGLALVPTTETMQMMVVEKK